MISWLKTRSGMTLGEFLDCLGDGVEKCDVHFSERGGPAVVLRPPFTEPDPYAAPYLDSLCSGCSFGFGPGTAGVAMTARVLLAPRRAVPALDVPID